MEYYAKVTYILCYCVFRITDFLVLLKLQFCHFIGQAWTQVLLGLMSLTGEDGKLAWSVENHRRKWGTCIRAVRTEKHGPSCPFLILGQTITVCWAGILVASIKTRPLNNCSPWCICTLFDILSPSKKKACHSMNYSP